MSVKRLGVSRFGLNCKKIYFRNGDQREFEKKKENVKYNNVNNDNFA